MHNHAPLLSVLKKLFERDPLLAAHTLETIDSDEAVEVLKVIPPTMVVEIIQHLNDAYCALLMEKLPASNFKKIVNSLDVQKAVSIFLRFSSEMRQSFLDLLDEKQKKSIQELLSYPEDSVGRVMSVAFIAFHNDTTVRDAIVKIRNLAKKGSALSYIYVVDNEGHLAGVMNMRDMLLCDSNEILEHIMRRDIFTVNCFDDVEKVANALSDRKYFAAPVVDSENRLLGVVRAEQLIGDVREAVSEDIQKMFGAGGDETAFSPVSKALRMRLPWLHVNLATAFLAAAVISMFEGLIARITVLAVYLPVIAGQGGNAGAQSLAIVMRGLVMREIPRSKALRLIVKETGIGMVNGIVIGIVTGFVAWIWQGNPFLGLVIGLGMFANLVIAGFSGAVIPLGMKAMNLDPAQCSSIILTTITDVMGFLVFLGLAVVFQQYLL